MKRRRTISRWIWILLIGSGSFTAVVWIIAHRLRPVVWSGDPALAALVVERDGLRENGDAARDALRAQTAAQKRDGWTSERLAAVSDEFGSAWRCAWETDHRLTVSRGIAPLRAWASCAGTLTDWAKKPGVVIDRVEVGASGSGHARHFAQVSFTLRFIAADAPSGNGERAFPSRGPLPVAPAVDAATPRKVGPPSLRLPSASAEPPASGTAVAPERTDPPGVRAALNNNSSSL